MANSSTPHNWIRRVFPRTLQPIDDPPKAARPVSRGRTVQDLKRGEGPKMLNHAACNPSCATVRSTNRVTGSAFADRRSGIEAADSNTSMRRAYRTGSTTKWSRFVRNRTKVKRRKSPQACEAIAMGAAPERLDREPDLAEPGQPCRSRSMSHPVTAGARRNSSCSPSLLSRLVIPRLKNPRTRPHRSAGTSGLQATTYSRAASHPGRSTRLVSGQDRTHSQQHQLWRTCTACNSTAMQERPGVAAWVCEPACPRGRPWKG